MTLNPIYNRIVLVLVCLFQQFLVFSQYPSVQWQNCFGGSDQDGGWDFKITSDNGFVLLIPSTSDDQQITGNHGNSDLVVIKIDSLRNIQWQISLGGSNYEKARTIHQTLDGGYILCGLTNSNDGDVTGYHVGNSTNDIWVVKLDSLGSKLWAKCYGGSTNDIVYDILELTDSSYLVFGSSMSNDGDFTGRPANKSICVIHISSGGSILTNYYYGSFGDGSGNSGRIIRDSNGGYVLINNGVGSQPNGSYNFILIKLDFLFNQQLYQGFGGSDWDEAWDGIQTYDGNYILCGRTLSRDGDVHQHMDTVKTNALVMKVSGQGAGAIWSLTMGGSGHERATCIKETPDRGLVIGVVSSSTDGDLANSGFHNWIDNIWIVKLDSLGTMEWNRCYGGSGGEDIYQLQILQDSGIVLFGSTYSNDFDVSGNHGQWDAWLAKLAFPLTSIPKLALPFQEFSARISGSYGRLGLRFFANHSGELYSRVFDISGRLLDEQSFISNEGINYKYLNIPKLPQGVYLVQLGDGLNYLTVKVVLE